ncbi:MAG: dUTP diphosphatase [Desulfohalobiaceae bacterium]
MLDSIEVKVKYLHPLWNQYPLQYATLYSAGLDLRACLEDESLCLQPGDKQTLSCGLALEIVSPGYAGFIYSRSGLGTKQGLVVTQGVGVIDPDYRGEIKVSLLNVSNQSQSINHGQRIAQLLFLPVRQARIKNVDALNHTERGEGGFGHSGAK